MVYFNYSFISCLSNISSETFLAKFTKNHTRTVKRLGFFWSYMWTFRREHFSPDFEYLPSFPSTFKIFCPWKKSSTKISWPTFCDQYFWKFPICNSCADEKCREIRMVKVNVIFNDIRLLICLTPLQVNWFILIN